VYVIIDFIGLLILYGLFSRIIHLYNSSIQNFQNLCRSVSRVHGQKCLDDDSASTITSQTALTHRLDYFEFIDVSYFGAVNFLPQNTLDAAFC